VSYPKSFDEVQAAWNEPDPEKIRAHLDRALSPSVVFCDPLYEIQGIDAFERMVRKFRTDLPNGRTEIASGMSHHHDLYRYEWNVYDGEKLLVPGMDVTRVDAEGRIERIDGFFGPIPPRED
jgi:hypothetical protein